MVQNPNETILFLNEIRNIARSRNVFVDLSGVKVVSPDAIAALLATIHHSRIRPAVVEGNVPNDGVAARMVNNSGFRDHVHTPGGVRYESPVGKVRKRYGAGDVFQTRFDQMVAKELVEFGTEKLHGTPRPNGPSFNILCEAMLNTLNHASRWPGTSGASIYYDDERRRACFTFIDHGVGIFRSYGLKRRLKIWVELNLLNDAQILRRLFEGTIRSSSGKPGRGNGIPRMYDHSKAQRVRNLTVVANKVKGEAEADRYDILNEPFPGTLLYWEIS
jgi:hypothetical protein